VRVRGVQRLGVQARDPVTSDAMLAGSDGAEVFA
jgi:hypothetical protein